MKVELSEIYNLILADGLKNIIRKYKKRIPHLINSRDGVGETLLHYAVYDQNYKLVKKLIDRGACPNTCNENGLDIFSLAAKTDDVKILGYIISQNISSITTYDASSMFATAATEGLVENIRCLLRHKLSCRGSYRGDSIIFWAVQSENIEVIRILHEAGAPIDRKNEDGQSPLYNASAWGILLIVKYLVSNGADVNQSTDDGCTPLIIACCFNKVDIVNYLLDNGAKINATDDKNRSALFYAVKKGFIDIVKLLIEKGAHVENKERYLKKVSRIKDSEVKAELQNILSF
jgi:ankyrin repeat protein